MLYDTCKAQYVYISGKEWVGSKGSWRNDQNFEIPNDQNYFKSI